MSRDLNTLNKDELGRLFPIVITESKAEWFDLFVEEKERLLQLLGQSTALKIAHIGSTAVPGLMAKPTIDILIEIPSGEACKRRIIDIMSSSGYNYMHNLSDHIMMVKGYTPTGFNGQCYHIHMGPKDHRGLWDRIFFRDYLKANPEVACKYAELKQQLAVKYRYDREAYTEAKTDFIVKITNIAIDLQLK